jgi:hypothetical protein
MNYHSDYNIKLAQAEELEKEMAYRKLTESPMVARQTQVSTQVCFLVEQTEKLAEMVGVLEARLAPLLRNEEPEPERKEIAEGLVEHAQCIRSRAWAIQKISDRIALILGRLEL